MVRSACDYSVLMYLVGDYDADSIQCELERLPEKWRDALTYKFLDNMSKAQVAKKMGTSVRFVKYWLGKGIMELRKRLEYGEKGWT